MKNLIVIIQENHSFDSYFGNYCQAATGSDPQCSEGPSCCEAGPKQVDGVSPLTLDDAQNLAFDPPHDEACEIQEINQGKMDRFLSGASCSDRRTFAYADAHTLSYYWSLANQGALADHYFQPTVGASSENDMYFAYGIFLFKDNNLVPHTAGSDCYPSSKKSVFGRFNLGDLLSACDVSWAFYSEGYRQVLNHPGQCLPFPNAYDPSDNPFQYSSRYGDHPVHQRDLEQLSQDLQSQSLPSVSFIKFLGVHSEHPGISSITSGESMVEQIVQMVQNSPHYKDQTLVLIVPDESGGFYDHIGTPVTSTVDHQPYGPRIPLLAVGAMVRKNYISHTIMEHSSIIRWIESNYLDGNPGQLGTRDAEVNTIESLLY